MAILLNGSTQYISAASAPGNLDDLARTVSFIFNTNSAARQFIYTEGGGGGGTSRFSVEIEPPVIYFNINNTRFGSAGLISTGTTYRVVMVYDGAGTAVMYVDGVVRVNQSGLTLTTASTPFSIGSAGGGSPFSGSISEVAKWNVALSSVNDGGGGSIGGDVASLRDLASPLLARPESLAFYAPLVRDIFDYKNGLALTNNGGATATTHPRIFR